MSFVMSMLKCTKKKKAPAVTPPWVQPKMTRACIEKMNSLTMELSPTAMLRSMEKQDGLFIVKTPEQFETLLSIEGDVKERVSSVKIERWPGNQSSRTKPSKISFFFFPKVKSRKSENNSPPRRPSKPTRGQLRELSQFPNLSGLDLSCQKEDFIASLVETPHLLPQRLVHLDLSYVRLGVAGARHLSVENVLPSTLISLRMKRTRIESAGVRQLLKSGALSKLTSLSSLDLSDNDIGNSSLTSLDPGVFPKELKNLNLEDNFLGDEVAEALSRPDVLPVGLTRLNLKNCKITSEGVQSLSNAQLPNLTDLTLSRNCIGTDGVSFLSDATFTGSLSRLDLSACGIGMLGAGRLLENRANFRDLKILNLSGNRFGHSAAFSLQERYCNLEKLMMHNTEYLTYHNPYGLNAEYWTKEDYELQEQNEKETAAREKEFRRLYW